MQRREEISLAAKARTQQAQHDMLDLDENSETYEKAKYTVCWFLELAKVGLDDPEVAHLIACVAKVLGAEKMEIAAMVDQRGVQWSEIHAHQPATVAHACSLLASDIRAGG